MLGDKGLPDLCGIDASRERIEDAGGPGLIALGLGPSLAPTSTIQTRSEGSLDGLTLSLVAVVITGKETTQVI